MGTGLPSQFRPHPEEQSPQHQALATALVGALLALRAFYAGGPLN